MASQTLAFSSEYLGTGRIIRRDRDGNRSGLKPRVRLKKEELDRENDGNGRCQPDPQANRGEQDEGAAPFSGMTIPLWLTPAERQNPKHDFPEPDQRDFYRVDEDADEDFADEIEHGQ